MLYKITLVYGNSDRLFDIAWNGLTTVITTITLDLAAGSQTMRL